MTLLDADTLLADPRATWRALDCADARENFADFCALIEIPQAPLKETEALDDEHDGVVLKPIERAEAEHIKLLQDALQKVDSGEITRLMLFVPPGGAKSTYASVCFPPWFMGRERRRNVILTTYATGLAKKHGRRARSIVRQPAYGEVFNTALSADTSAADEWSLTNENEFMAGGIRSGITGNRADLIVIDDPIKGREEADSQTIRDKTWEEYEASLRTRLKPGGRIVLIQTRWHEDDLAGRILPEDYDGETGWIQCRDGDRWYVICIPAQADRDDDPLGRARGEFFWPEWFPASHWSAPKLNPRNWAALYQQKPKPDEGSYFMRSWFPRFQFRELPQSVRFYITSDYATKDGSGDWTVHAVWAVDTAMNVWLVALWREQTTSDQWVESLIDLICEYRTKGGGQVKCYGESGVIWNSVLPLFNDRCRKRKVAVRVETLSSQGADKAGRARGFQGMAREGRVRVIDDMSGDVFIEELVTFPASRNDDQVDAAAIIGRVIDRVQAPASPNRPQFAESNDAR